MKFPTPLTVASADLRSAMELNIEKISGVTVIPLPFDHLDASNCEELERILTPLLESSPKVVLDMASVKFVDSSGVGVLLFCIRKVEGQGGILRICNPAEPVKMAFDLVRIHRLVEIYDSRPLAIDAFTKGRDRE